MFSKTVCALSHDKTSPISASISSDLGVRPRVFIKSTEVEDKGTYAGGGLSCPDSDKPAALLEAEYLVPLTVNKYSHGTTPLFSRNDSSPHNRCDTFQRMFAIIYYYNHTGDII
ncbi:hypothetical protein TNCV_1157071 [Trichonephila clavipes]|nr:hypothetical protein TNCV_1157071 [Trichonephila clavipes]